MRSALAALLIAAALAATPALCASGPALPQGPLTLDDCTAIALARNPQIAASQQQVVGAQAALTRARSDYYPQLSLDAVEGVTDRTTGVSSGGASASGSNTREELDLALRMTFWQQGRREGVAATRSSLRAARFDDASTVQGLVEQVAGDFYSVLAAQQLVGVAQAGVESAQGHLDEVKARIAAGDVADVDVFPAEDDLARAQLDLIEARSNLRLAQAGLKNSMGVTPETQLKLAESPAPEGQAAPSLADALQKAHAARPEVRAAEAQAQASGYALAQAKIERGPVAALSAEAAQRYPQWAESDSSWDVLLSVSWPLFDGHATRAAVTAARASLERSRADLQRVVNQVGLEVESALVEVERARERVTASDASVAAARSRLNAAEGKYQQGRGILIEVIDARVAVTTALASQVQARYDYRIALVGLKRALGTLTVPQRPGAQGESTP